MLLSAFLGKKKFLKIILPPCILLIIGNENENDSEEPAEVCALSVVD